MLTVGDKLKLMRAGTRHARGFTDAGVSSAPLERQRYQGNPNRGTTGCMQPICTYELRLARERFPTSCLVMAPPVTRRAHEMRRLSGAGLGIDT